MLLFVSLFTCHFPFIDGWTRLLFIEIDGCTVVEGGPIDRVVQGSIGCGKKTLNREQYTALTSFLHFCVKISQKQNTLQHEVNFRYGKFSV